MRKIAHVGELAYNQCEMGAKTLYSFPQILSAFAKIHEVKQEHMLALRGKIQNYQKLGVVPFVQGRGKRVRYSLDDVYMWALCLEFSEFNVDPKIISDIVSRQWSRVNHGFFDKGKKDWFIHFRPSFVVDPTLRFATAQNFNAVICQDENLKRYLSKNRTNPAVSDDTIVEFTTRHGTINVSHVRRQIDSALATAAG